MTATPPAAAATDNVLSVPEANKLFAKRTTKQVVLEFLSPIPADGEVSSVEDLEAFAAVSRAACERAERQVELAAAVRERARLAREQASAVRERAQLSRDRAADLSGRQPVGG